MIWPAVAIIVVEPGSIITDPLTGAQFTIDDDTICLDRRRGRVWMTSKSEDAFRRRIDEVNAAR